MNSNVVVVREFDKLTDTDKLSSADFRELQSVNRSIVKAMDGQIFFANYVGVFTTSNGKAVEILPKIDLANGNDPLHTRTRELFLRMLRHSRAFPKKLTDSRIRELKHYPMLRVFVQQFLQRVQDLVRRGLARKYVSQEFNRPVLRGRILFVKDFRENQTNRARFFTSSDELIEDRPANRLIATTLLLLARIDVYGEQSQLLTELSSAFVGVPASTDIHGDWRTHHLDRSMSMYRNVMPWIGLFLFNSGLSTFVGRHSNVSLLFPMERVFEDYVSHCIRRFTSRYVVQQQGPKKFLGKIGENSAFQLKPDITMSQGANTVFIADVKWKAINNDPEKHTHGVLQSDVYQLLTYAIRYKCHTVALVYPKTREFNNELSFRLASEFTLLCFPFDIENPETSVQTLVNRLEALSQTK